MFDSENSIGASDVWMSTVLNDCGTSDSESFLEDPPCLCRFFAQMDTVGNARYSSLENTESENRYAVQNPTAKDLLGF